MTTDDAPGVKFQPPTAAVADPPPAAAPDPLGPDENAPYGYTIDRKSGEKRPKKLPGRPGAKTAPAAPPPGETPSLDDLKAGKKAKTEEDRPPGKPKTARPGRRTREEEPLPPFRAGPIATGMNKLYARTGKIVRVMDYDIGTAILATTRKESEEDVTVGEAWEEVAKTNPRIRRVLLKMIAGGAWTQLVMAHAPIFLAIVMKDAIAKHIPFLKLIEAVLGNDEETGEESEVSQFLGGLKPEDAQQMMDVATHMMGPMMANLMGNGRPGKTGREPVTVPGEVVGEE